MMKREICRPDQVEMKLLTLKSAIEPVMLWFTATKQADGSRWCPDCVQAEEIIEEALLRAPASLQLIVVEITKEGSDHQLRKEPYSVEGIPTLALWDTKESKTNGGMLGEHECQQLEYVSSFVDRLNSGE